MEHKRQTLELLAPAGSLESVKAAVAAGADAVYMGGSQFGARAFADSVQENSVEQAIDYVHLHGKKLYLTVNTLLKERELEEELHSFLEPYYCQGVDGVIVQDLGVFSYLKKHFPELPLHASTQMTVTGVDSARLLQEMGASRVVAARELNLQEIAEIYSATQMEVEAFVHGAICYCYSGQCLYSSLIGGRSGNRGRCAQPCRLPYIAEDIKGKRLNSKRETYLLSLKDMCTLQSLPQLIEAGVMSFKIEGRMKSPVYTAGVVSIYRKYIDQYLAHPECKWQVEKEDLHILSQLFDRGGFTETYLHQHNGKAMLALQERPDFRAVDTKVIEFIEKTYIKTNLQEKVSANVTILTDSCATITLRLGNITAQAALENPVVPAQNKPLTEEIVRKQMNKTGQASYTWELLEIQLSENAFLPVQQLNHLRRQGMQALEEAVKAKYRRVCPPIPSEPPTERQCHRCYRMQEVKAQLTVSVLTLEQLSVVLQYSEITKILLEWASCSEVKLADTVYRCHRAGKLCYLQLPYIFRQADREQLSVQMQRILDAGIDGIVVRNLDEIGFLKTVGWQLPVQFDSSFYIWNREARNCVKQLILADTDMTSLLFTAPLELNHRELADIGCQDMEVICYGYLPMMVSAGCIQNTTTGCTRQNRLLWLRDRKNQRFPVLNFCNPCYNIIYNSVPISLLDKIPDIRKLQAASVRAAFTIETSKQMEDILQSMISAFTKEQPVQTNMPFTRGHFARGVR